MLSLRSLFWCAFVLSSVPSLAWAAEPSLVTWAEQRVNEGLIKPLAKLSGSRFSRERPTPHERRVRIGQDTLSLDKSGRAFVPFAIDVRFADEWHENDVLGCAYRATGELFVKRYDGYSPAAYLLGKKVATVAGACETAPARS